MTTTAGHSFYIGPIGSFYNQVNDTGSLEPLVSLRIIRTTDRSEGINLSNIRLEIKYIILGVDHFLSVSRNLMYIHLSFQKYGHYGGGGSGQRPK
jgi:hypothetical protein